MSLSRKDASVPLDTIDPLAAPGLIAIWAVWERLFPGRVCVITATTNGTHMKGSLHGKGKAFDIRTKTLFGAEKLAFLGEVKKALGGDWDVLLEDKGGENEHLHAELDPKG